MWKYFTHHPVKPIVTKEHNPIKENNIDIVVAVRYEVHHSHALYQKHILQFVQVDSDDLKSIPARGQRVRWSELVDKKSLGLFSSNSVSEIDALKIFQVSSPL